MMTVGELIEKLIDQPLDMPARIGVEDAEGVLWVSDVVRVVSELNETRRRDLPPLSIVILGTKKIQ